MCHKRVHVNDLMLKIAYLASSSNIAFQYNFQRTIAFLNCIFHKYFPRVTPVNLCFLQPFMWPFEWVYVLVASLVFKIDCLLETVIPSGRTPFVNPSLLALLYFHHLYFQRHLLANLSNWNKTANIFPRIIHLLIRILKCF